MLSLGILPVWAGLAALLNAAGLGLVFTAWRRRLSRHGGLLWAGWSLTAIAIPAWIIAAGPDRGPAFAGLFICVTAGVFLAVQYVRPDNARHARRQRAMIAPAAKTSLLMPSVRTVWSAVLAGPVAAIASVTLSAHVYGGLLAMGWTQPDVLLICLLIFPLSWAALAVTAASSYRLRWRSMIITIAALIPASLIFLPSPL